ncbi:hypothetical protein RHMOL_Rhmol01G0239800 [Rhododendron molle]|uniref:Uncharacterized protein n=1 Tax=Rhododendron molle TaxID=49168 RepID=A0ACC0Q534_RHOML|nr:hypothetical protein RHMOL_Rhmol01G0239800 [Rhododendron molle]
MYHCHTKHPTSDCWSLKRLFKRKQNANELRIGRRDICVDPYLAHRNHDVEVHMAECYPFMYEDEENADSYYYLEEDDEEAWAYIVSCYEITEEFGDGVALVITPDPNASGKAL